MLLFSYVRMGVCSGPVRVSSHSHISLTMRVGSPVAVGASDDGKGRVSSQPGDVVFCSRFFPVHIACFLSIVDCRG